MRARFTPERDDLLDPQQPGWIGAFVRGETRGLEGVIGPIAPHATVRAEISDGAVNVDVDLAGRDEPVNEPDVVAFMRIGMLASWQFQLA